MHWSLWMLTPLVVLLLIFEVRSVGKLLDKQKDKDD
jgi:hypothetical protein